MKVFLCFYVIITASRFGTNANGESFVAPAKFISANNVNSSISRYLVKGDIFRPSLPNTCRFEGIFLLLTLYSLLFCLASLKSLPFLA